MKKSSTHLIWIDCEMTGLDPKSDRIIEIATVVTDSNLNVLAEGPVIAIHQAEEKLNSMDEWNTKQHNESGLIKRVNESSHNESNAELETLAFLQHWVPGGSSPMCGNSICQDRRFLVEYMPNLANYFHYRNLDVSTLKILAQRWAPAIDALFTKQSQHLALQDIHDSINELKHYRSHFLKVNDNPASP
jgi:oligoribonuclease